MDEGCGRIPFNDDCFLRNLKKAIENLVSECFSFSTQTKKTMRYH